MLYFVLSLILSLTLSGAVLAGLVKSLQINWSRSNKRPVSFLAPVVLLIVFLVLTIHLAVPRILDMVNVFENSLSVDEVQVEAGEIGWNTLSEGQRTFFYNQWHFQPLAGKTYRIVYTPRSLYISEFSEIVDTAGGRP